VVLITVMLGSIVLVITGLGLLLIGIVPGVEEIWRILVYLVISVVYISFWLGWPSFFPSCSAAPPPPPWPLWRYGSFSLFL